MLLQLRSRSGSCCPPEKGHLQRQLAQAAAQHDVLSRTVLRLGCSVCSSAAQTAGSASRQGPGRSPGRYSARACSTDRTRDPMMAVPLPMVRAALAPSCAASRGMQ